LLCSRAATMISAGEWTWLPRPKVASLRPSALPQPC
jgi:hypothetical protein